MKPDPNYGFVHDSSVLPSKKLESTFNKFYPKVIKNEKMTSTRKMNDFAKTDAGFRRSNVQKLDNFIKNY